MFGDDAGERMTKLNGRLLSVLIVAALHFAPTAAAQTPSKASGQGAAAASWPTRPVRMIVGFSPGSASDITARIVAPKLAELWGQPLVIENRSGAGGSIAFAMAAQASPDGYTLLMITSSFAINAVLRPNVGYDPLRDFASVIQIGYPTGVLAVSPALGVKSVKALIALALERPGKILFGSSGAGSGVHMSAERFRMVAGIKTTHVAFKGQPEMLIEILAGRVHYGLPSLGPSLAMIRDGRLLALAVLTPKRSPLLPDIPAMTEILPAFRRDVANALMVPAKTPRAIVNRINKDVVRVLEMPDVKKQMEAIDFVPAPTTPEEFDQVLRGMLVTFEEVARAAGLK
jgi:tripartite-type tricarboxylate transporter receptor subunit TctC